MKGIIFLKLGQGVFFEAFSITGKVSSKTNKKLWTMKSSQQNMLLFDKIVQP